MTSTEDDSSESKPIIELFAEDHEFISSPSLVEQVNKVRKELAEKTEDELFKYGGVFRQHPPPLTKKERDFLIKHHGINPELLPIDKKEKLEQLFEKASKRRAILDLMSLISKRNLLKCGIEEIRKQSSEVLEKSNPSDKACLYLMSKLDTLNNDSVTIENRASILYHVCGTIMLPFMALLREARLSSSLQAQVMMNDFCNKLPLNLVSALGFYAEDMFAHQDVYICDSESDEQDEQPEDYPHPKEENKSPIPDESKSEMMFRADAATFDD